MSGKVRKRTNMERVVVESCVEQVGKEWAETEDVGFWGEADVRARLLGLLRQPALTVGINIKLTGRFVPLPLAHAECLGAKSRPITHQGPFDIAVFKPESIGKFANEARWKSNWQEETRKLEVSVVIEIKNDNGDRWNDNIRKDLDKLVERLQVDPIEYGYLLILYDATEEQLQWVDIKDEIAQKRTMLPSNKGISVYFAPCGDNSVVANWI